MKRSSALFIDTAFVYAIINPRDQQHKQAIQWQFRIEAEKLPLVTTEFILAEIADGLSAVNFRRDAALAIHILQENPYVEIVPATSALFLQALKLYEERPDKNWGLTDCASFAVMTENNRCWRSRLAFRKHSSS